MVDFCRQGYWRVVLPQDVVLDWPNLRVSPLGIVPQRDRRPRLIVDYSYSNVNAETVQLAPHEAMQFGRALQRVLSIIVHANRRYGPVHMAKIDIADGFLPGLDTDRRRAEAWSRAPDSAGVPTVGCLSSGATDGVGTFPPVLHCPYRDSVRPG